MKRTSLASRFLAVLLTVAMLVTLLVPAISAEEPAKASDGAQELELTAIDPATLHVSKLGELDEEPAKPVEQSPYAMTDLVRVSIVLDGEATLDRFPADGVGTNAAANAYRSELRAQQDAVQARIEAALGKSIDVKWNLTLAMNLISANVRYGDLDAIRAVSGVREAFLEGLYEAPVLGDDAAEPNTANTSEAMVGAVQAWAEGYTGAGHTVAIIDTGVDYEHQSFNADAFNYAIQQTGKPVTLMTAASYSGLTLNGSGRYVSAKIPFGYNYVDRTNTLANLGHLQDTAGDHGSHVAGIAAANRFIKSGSSYNSAADTVHAVGMAPDAQILIMKVFGAGGGAADSDYMAAIEDCLTMGVDVCNLSLGSAAPGFTTSDAYQNVMNKLANGEQNTKLVVSISAGNAGAFADNLQTDLYIDDVYMHTGGSPGTYTNSLCVASADNTGATGMPLTYNGQNFFYTETDSTGAKMATIAGTWSFVYIDAFGEAEDYAAVNSAVSLSGKIVIVNRGETSFYEKGNNAISYGPKAVIVANNQPGTINMSLDDYTGTFPMVSITLADAQTIKDTAASGTAGGCTYYTGSLTVNSAVIHGVVSDNAEISVFSSWGVPGSLIMKPEITAPGGNIYSVYGSAKTSSGGTEGGSDQYVSFSGTSMAAPHITGLTAVLAQYLAENNISVTGHTDRQLIQSLLMSTAEPMYIDSEEGPYYPILQQGAGLANVSDAIHASSVIFMGEDATASYADGKVKAELGDKPSKSGTYTYSFELHNLADTAQTYDLRTDLFTQDRYEDVDGYFHMDYATAPLDWRVTYAWEGAAVESHDVDLDGDTDEADAQAILDYLVGVRTAAQVDLTAADLDGDGAVSSRDAYLLLDWTPAAGENELTVPAGGSRTVTVTIHIPADTSDFDAAYPSGAYVEGFTYVESRAATRDGARLDVTHSIPILGFYGSWTDPSMFDNMSYVDGLYGETRIPYSGKSDTNYLTVTYGGSPAKFTGNPYIVEDEFPADRLALSTASTVGNAVYNLIRSAGTTGFAISKLDADHNVTDVLNASVAANEVTGQWFYDSQQTWQNTGTKFYTANKALSSLGLSEGDLFRAGFYAIPEYNAMLINEDTVSSDCGMLDNAGFQALLLENVLGDGAFVGYDFTVDNTDPVISDATLSDGTLSVTASDNLNLAYVAVLSLDGETVYAEQAPGAPTANITLDASNAIANAKGYVAVFAGDYAGNEAAVAVKVNDNCYVDKTAYVLTDTLTEGSDYLICEVNAAGTGHILGYTAGSGWFSSNTVTANAVTVAAGDSATNGKPYIEPADVPDTAVWTASAGIRLMNNGNYLRRGSNTSTSLSISNSNSYNTWSYDAANSRLGFTDRATYLRYYNNTFSLNTSTSYKIYLYVKTEIHAEVQPYVPTSIKLTPESLDLYKGNTADVIAKVLPLTATDRTVTWSSSNTAVATVDQNGHVTAVSAGSANIIATANGNPAVTATCAVSVTVVTKSLNGIIWDEAGDVYFSTFNANSLPTWNKSHNDAKSLPLASAFMQSSSNLYAGTLNTSSAETKLYTVNRNTYALTEYGTNFVYATDMAIAASTYSQYVGFAYSFGYFLVAGPIAPGDDGTGAQYTGLPYAAEDFSSFTGGAYFAGIATKSRSSQGGTFYALDENGVIWQTTLGLNSDQNGFEFSTPTKVVETGIGTSFLYQNLYYDGTWLYWCHQADNIAELIIINPNTGVVYHAGDFGEGVWPATGLYVNGSIAPASVEEPAELTAEPKTVISREELMTEEIMARFAAEAEKFAKDEPANAVVGGTNAARPSASVKHAEKSSGEAENGTATVTVTDTEDVNNGFITMTYDPAVLTYTGYTSDFGHIAVWNDAANGVIKLAYADTTAHKDIAVVNFTYAGDTLNTVVTVNSLERNTNLALEEYVEIQLKVGSKPVSVYVVDELDGADVYAWAWGSAGNLDADWPGHALTAEGTEKGGHNYYKIDLDLVDYDKLIFNRNGQPQTGTLDVAADAGENDYVVYYIYGVSGNDLSASVGADLWPAPGVVYAPTCTEPGYTVYTGMFTGETETGNFVPALGHDYVAVVIEPNCTEGGYTAYTCSRCGDAYTADDTDALGHSYGEPVWTWTEETEGYSVTATFTCSVCGDELVMYANVTDETTPATATEDGQTVYTAAVELDGVTYTDTKTVVIPATGPVEPIETTDLQIFSTISVGTDMVVTLTVRKTALTNYSKFWIEVVKHAAEGDETYLYGAEQEEALTEGPSSWKTDFKHIFAKEMGVEIEARVYAEDANGQVYRSPAKTTNIRDYLAGKLTLTNNKVEQRVLAADMLNYGAAAQLYMDYDTEHLVNQEVTAEQLAKLDEYETKELPLVEKENANTVPAGQTTILYNTVSLDNEVVLTLAVRADQNAEVKVLKKDHDTGTVLETLDTAWMGSSHKVEYKGLGADQMRVAYDFVATVNGVETGNIRTWSVEGYVGEIRAGSNQLKTDMANALLTYGDSAAAYFAAQ